MLLMFLKMPVLTCGFIAPFLWTGLAYSILGIVSPILDQRIDWPWFTISQCAFGLVAGFVVNLDVKVRTSQLPGDCPLLLGRACRAISAGNLARRTAPNECGAQFLHRL